MAPPVRTPSRPRGVGPAGVLVVDDDVMMRLLIRRTLEAAGCTVWAAGGVADASRMLPTIARELDVVLVDVVMPGGLGPDLAASIRQTRPQPRVIYMSSHTSAKLASHGVDLGGAEFLPKPFMPAQLLAQVAGVR